MASREEVSVAVAEAERVFESFSYSVYWIDEPNPALGGKSPRSMLDIPDGLTLVLRELKSVEYGLPI